MQNGRRLTVIEKAEEVGVLYGSCQVILTEIWEWSVSQPNSFYDCWHRSKKKTVSLQL